MPIILPQVLVVN